MKIAHRLLREFWLPAAFTAAWTIYNVLTDSSSVWGLKEYVNILGPCFFLASWVTGQFFRVQKQAGFEKNLTRIDARVEHVVNQLAGIERMLESVVPERRADPALIDESTEIIPLSHVVDFFDLIAPFYNKRNSGKYLATYVEIDAAIRSSRASIEGITICDLGGGTGFLLQLFQYHGVHWTNIDISTRSLAIFKSDFTFYSHKSLRNFDVCKDLFIKPGEHFDVVVMSYLLSSLDCPPDFGQIREAMHDQSLLVVADNHFTYVQKNPLYGYEGVEGRNVAIEPRPIDPEKLRAQVQKAGFVQISYKIVSIEDEPYSQVHVFKKG